MIESLNDDGYLEDSLPALASGLAGDDNDQFDELVHHFQVALGLLQSLEPAGVGARDLGECLAIQLRALADEDETEDEELVRKTALAICKQPMELLARRDFKRLATLTRTNEELVRSALQVIARLEPAGPPLRRRRAQHRHSRRDRHQDRPRHQREVPRHAQPEVMPRLRVHDIYAGALKSQ